jgi:predicted transcriptional regulator of viral defense system
MKRETLIDIVSGEPLFTTGMLLTPEVDVRDVRKQLSRWTSDGTVVQLRRGLYSLGPRYRLREPHPYEISNALVRGSYVSLETVLAANGLIPEAVFATTAVTTGRQGFRQTPFGSFVYQHIKPQLFWGYESELIGDGRDAFVATPEKALLDLAYLRTRSDETSFARELRLQRLETIDAQRLLRFAERFGSKKVLRFARNVNALRESEREEYRG